MNHTDKSSSTPIHIDSTGPWPFISRHVFLWPTGERTLFCSRHHRKGLYRVTQETGLLRCLWMPEQPNWWIGIGFSLGAMLFILGSILVLIPSISRDWSLGTNSANIVFFVGSIPFTIAAYLQLFQAANAGVFSAKSTSAPKQRVLFGWHPHQIGWLSCALQFIGTLLFNINTFDGMLPQMDWLQQDLAIWAPDFVGSILFLFSGYLAFIETCHAYWLWNPSSLSWWVTYMSFLGCVAFMISAFFSYVPARSLGFDVAAISAVFTLIGGVCFFFGALLMLPETAQTQDTEAV